MPKHPQQFSWNYEDLRKITGLSYEAVIQHRTRKYFDPENLESVLIYAARYAQDAVKVQLLRSALSYPTRERALPRAGSRKRPPKR